jgi:hypothetical protein
VRTYINGAGADSTAAVLAYLAANRSLKRADLYVISPGPNFAGCALNKSWLLTNWPSPLTYTPLKTFSPANIKRDGVKSKIGLEADQLKLTWYPVGTEMQLQSGGISLSLLQAFQGDVFDGGMISIYRVEMPTPGDCNTLGACLLFQGNIGDVEAGRSSIEISVNSRVELVNAQVPSNTVESTNVGAQYSIGAFPAGQATPPAFAVAADTTLTVLQAAVYGSPSGFSPQNGDYDFGYLAFHPPGLLGGIYRDIRRSLFSSGVAEFYLYEPLPFLPASGDLFTPLLPVPRDYAGAVALNESSPQWKISPGFPYVPSPETGI